jgi:hypothetical protein
LTFERPDGSGVRTDPMQILDDMAPHAGQGSTATQDWWRDIRPEWSKGNQQR